MAEFYVLAVLAQRKRGAYTLCRQIAAESSHSIIISDGHMSRLLSRLADEGLITSEMKVGRTTPYNLTDNGRDRLRDEISKHQRAIFIAEKNLHVEPPVNPAAIALLMS